MSHAQGSWGSDDTAKSVDSSISLMEHDEARKNTAMEDADGKKKKKKKDSRKQKAKNKKTIHKLC